MRLQESLVPLLLSGLWSHAWGQVANAGVVSLNVGQSTNAFRYVSRTGGEVAITAPFPVYSLTSDHFLISGGFRSTAVDPSQVGEKSSLLELVGSAGGSVGLFDHLASLPLKVAIPIRTALEYRRVEAQGSNTASPSLVDATIGLGLSAALRFPAASPRMVVTASSLTSLGGITDLRDSLSHDVLFARSADAAGGITFPRAIRAGLGISFGATWKSLRWTDDSPQSFKDVVDATRRPASVPKHRAQRVLSLGLTWSAPESAASRKTGPR